MYIPNISVDLFAYIYGVTPTVDDYFIQIIFRFLVFDYSVYCGIPNLFRTTNPV